MPTKFRLLLRTAVAGLLGAAVLAAPSPAAAATPTLDVAVYVGDGTFDPPVDGGNKLGSPRNIAFDPSGDMYTVEGMSCRVLKITPAKVISVIAGSGGCGDISPGGPATQVGFPRSVARHNGNTYVGTDRYIYQIDPQGILSVVAGTGSSFPALVDGPAAGQAVYDVTQMAVVGDTLYFCQMAQAAKIDLNTMQLTVIAGNSTTIAPAVPGPALASTLGWLSGIAVAADDTVYLADAFYESIYKIAPDGTLSVLVTLPAGHEASSLLIGPVGTPYAGNLYASLNTEMTIVEVDTTATNGNATLTVVAGSGWTFPTTTKMPALSARLNQTQGLGVSPAGDFYASLANAAQIVELTPAGPSAPQPPTAAGAQVGDESAVVSWTAPGDDGGSPVTSYDVQAYSGGNAVAGKTCTATAPTLTCTVTGLTNGAAYTYRVTATNLIGTSAESVASAAVTPLGAAGAPTVANVASTASGSATLTWTAPGVNGGSPVTSYTVQAYAAGQAVAGRTCTVNSPALTCTVTGLTNGTAYTLRVTATTSAGPGAESADSAPVTPVGPSGAPTTVLVTAGNGQVAVSWTAPGNTGGAPITSYTAQAYQAGLPAAGRTCTTATLSCLVTGLTNGTAYTLRVTATTSAGPGAASADSAPVTPVAPAVPVTPAPGAPGTPAARGATSSIKVSWPASAGQVTDYTAVAMPGGNSCTTTSTSCVIGAEAGRAYTITVVAHGPGGASPASAPSASVTPTAPITPPGLPANVPPTLTTDQGPLSLVLPKQEITLTGSGFAPNSTTKVTLYSAPIELGTVTTDANGAFALTVAVPAGVPAGGHTILAQGVDGSGAVRQMALPVIVPPTSPTSSGGGDQNQNTKLPVPAGGSITLLSTTGDPVGTLPVKGQGTYALDTTTGVITFVPVAGFAGRATAVQYRITDAVGRVVTGSYTAVVTAAGTGQPGPGAPSGPIRLVTPARLITKVDGTALVRITHSGAVTGRSTVVLWSTVSGKRVSFGSASVPAGRSIVVPVPLNALGRAMTARPGGYPVTVAATTGSALRATAATRVVLQHFQLPRSIYFASGSTAVSREQAAYLTGLRARLGGVRALTCAGYTDNRGSDAYARTVSTLRARVVCRALATGLGIRMIIVGQGKATTGNGTEPGKARNRRADITLHY
ncbi:fibronectin type III domain-containing protein [Actinoplanes sp. NPDC048796]|uniref:fibronectin type III domain-containing protein n=1 Tax=unclassified Actinoplanes TaxID=2626549 RepID=UPI00340FACE3